VAPDEKLVCIASADPFVLGVLCSKIHEEWALAVGARLEDRPTYNNSLCFDPFPFPAAAPEQLAAVRDAIEARPATAAELAATFLGARGEVVARHLETLEVLGELRRDPEGRYRRGAGEAEVV
jgi:hypothetical protein